MNVGDYISSRNAIIVRELDFKQWCDKHDELEVEYDIDALWEFWGEKGRKKG